MGIKAYVFLRIKANLLGNQMADVYVDEEAIKDKWAEGEKVEKAIGGKWGLILASDRFFSFDIRRFLRSKVGWIPEEQKRGVAFREMTDN